MIYKCTDYDYNSLKGYAKDIGTDNFNIIQRASNLIPYCQELQTDENEATINKIMTIIGELIGIASRSEYSRLGIIRTLNDFKQGVR